jgi:hypothetical protein
LPAQLLPWLDRGLGLARVDFDPKTRISSAPRWLFFRLAVLVTLLLWLPDLYLLDLGQPGRAVAVLMVMHLAIALVTYYSLVCIAKVRPAVRRASHARVAAVGPGRYAEYRRY